MDYDRPLSAEEREVLRGYVTRRGQGEPLQYIAGEVGFRHMTPSRCAPACSSRGQRPRCW